MNCYGKHSTERSNDPLQCRCYDIENHRVVAYTPHACAPSQDPLIDFLRAPEFMLPTFATDSGRIDSDIDMQYVPTQQVGLNMLTVLYTLTALHLHVCYLYCCRREQIISLRAIHPMLRSRWRRVEDVRQRRSIVLSNASRTAVAAGVIRISRSRLFSSPLVVIAW